MLNLQSESVYTMTTIEYDLDTSGGLMPVSINSTLGAKIVSKWRLGFSTSLLKWYKGFKNLIKTKSIYLFTILFSFHFPI